MMIPEKHSTIAVNSPPVSDAVSFRYKDGVPKAVSWITSPDDGTPVMPTKDYGIGIDCHSRFLEVIVLVKRDSDFFEYCREVDTSWDSIKEAYTWALHVLGTCADPPVQLSSPLIIVSNQLLPLIFLSFLPGKVLLASLIHLSPGQPNEKLTSWMHVYLPYMT